MAMNEKTRLTVNRIVSMIAGGLLVFAVMSVTVVSNANSRNAQLSEALDTSRYEAGRLLAAAEEHLENRNYTQAKASLATLFENQPGSSETIEGKTLLTAVESAENAANMQWETALPAVREQWTTNMAAELRTESDAARAELESNMDTILSEKWEQARNDARDEWEMQQQQ